MDKLNQELNFKFDNGILSEKRLEQFKKIVFDEISVINEALSSKKYVNDFASLLLPDETKFLEESQKLSKNYSDFSELVVIGIGGSNLGALAVIESLKGLYHSNGKNIYFADTTDSFKIFDLLKVLEKKVEKGKKIILNLISKSGSTTESIANFEVFLHFLKKHFPKTYSSQIIFTTDKNSPLDLIAKSHKYKVLHIPKKVGGRYSVFSNVGLFPLSFMGIDTKQFLQGAKDMKKQCLKKSTQNPALMSCLTLFNSAFEKKRIVNHFLFVTQLKSFGIWYRQLLGESIGKEFSKDSKLKINFGLTPTYAIGSTDLHSMAQLYLGGPNNTYHVFVNVKNTPTIKLPIEKEYEQIVSNIQGKNLDQIMQAIYAGTKQSFIQKNIPFSEIELTNLNEYTIGALLQMKMFEVIYLGLLLDVDPFDQPNVEEYKSHTRAILKNG